MFFAIWQKIRFLIFICLSYTRKDRDKKGNNEEDQLWNQTISNMATVHEGNKSFNCAVS